MKFKPAVCILTLVFIMAAKTRAQTTKPDSLTIYRQQIDSLDKKLIEILGKRMQVVVKVGKYKAKNNIPALQQNRFDALLKKNIEMGKMYQLSDVFVTDVMNAIHKEALAKEDAIAAQSNPPKRE